MTHFNPPSRNAVIAAIKEHGPMTCAEVAEALGWPHSRAHETIANARRWQPGKVFRVVRYRKTMGKGKDPSVYAVQAGPDVPRPVIDRKARRKEIDRRYQRKNQAIINARERAERAAKVGPAAPTNLWMGLAPVGVRPLMTIAARESAGAPR